MIELPNGGERKKKSLLELENMRLFKLLEVPNCYIEIRSYTLNFSNLWINCVSTSVNVCVCLCMYISFLFFCVCFCVSVFCIDCVWGRERERVIGACDNRDSILKAMGNMPLDGCHFAARGFSLPSQVSLLTTALNNEKLDSQKASIFNYKSIIPITYCWRRQSY